MNTQIQHAEQIETLDGYISTLKEMLSKLYLPEEAAKEIRKHLENERKDYSSLQSIIDILASLPKNIEYEGIIKFKNYFHIYMR